MGKVIVSLRVNPESDEVNLDKLVTEIKSKLPTYYENLKTAKSTFQQLLMPFNISWEEVAGGIGLTYFTSSNNSADTH
ncbi:MAG: hypothetical protein ACK416_02790 [Zestosphaera sp.]